MSMTAQEHQDEAERLLSEAKRGQRHLGNLGSMPTPSATANLHVIDQHIAMAHVHALLSGRA